MRQASSPAAPTTIPETPTTHLTFLHDNTLAGNAFSSLSSPIASCSPSPTAPRGIATYDGIAEYRTPSLPQSSANSTNASKRTFSGGKPVVLNSDSDSDSLTDLDELLNHEPIGKPKAVTRVATAGREEDSTRSGLPRPPKRLKDDNAFKRLVQAAQKNAEMEQNIAKAQAELDKPLREHSLKHDLQISEEMVAGALHDEDDPEKAKKLYLAMQRTNAFQVDCAFHFFDRESDDDSAFHLPFPLESLSHPRMASKFEGRRYDFRGSA
ncbi:hypothetical protein SLS60_004991 [Paraconiothyrium brasiliense]|uniref:Uncharacterized protein n=1 Tax=Paraconiothyrium brasiliense TaxID=300254 RepID=A0ABR3RLV1_9PLEO